MNILFLSPVLNHCCGVSRHMLLLGHELSARGHRIVVMSSGGTMIPDFRDVGIEHLPTLIDPARKSAAAAIRIAAAIGRTIRRQHVDIVHSHHRWPELIASIVAPLFRVPTVMTCHAILARQRLLSYRSDALIAVSGAVSRSLVADFGIPPSRIHVVPNAPRVLAVPTPEDVARFRTQHGVPRDTLIVTGVGRLHPEKGFDLLLQAVRLLGGVEPGIHGLIVGDGPDRGKLQEAARRDRLPVTFAGELANVGLAYAATDILVVPSRAESSGLVPLEAAGFRKPVVATAVGGLPELFDDPARGMLIPPESPAALAAAIRGLALDAERRASLGRALAAYVEAHRSPRVFVDQVESVYRAIRGERGGRDHD